MTQHTPTATNTRMIAFAPDYSAAVAHLLDEIVYDNTGQHLTVGDLGGRCEGFTAALPNGLTLVITNGHGDIRWTTDVEPELHVATYWTRTWFETGGDPIESESITTPLDRAAVDALIVRAAATRHQIEATIAVYLRADSTSNWWEVAAATFEHGPLEPLVGYLTNEACDCGDTQACDQAAAHMRTVPTPTGKELTALLHEALRKH